LLEELGWDMFLERARAGAEHLRRRLAERLAAPAAATPLVTWRTDGEPAEQVDRLAASGVIVRAIPGRPWLRASVGAWNCEDDLERLLAAL
jgi:selenocysteine lyase/cysteine desulfurase